MSFCKRRVTFVKTIKIWSFCQGFLGFPRFSINGNQIAGRTYSQKIWAFICITGRTFLCIKNCIIVFIAKMMDVDIFARTLMKIFYSYSVLWQIFVCNNTIKLCRACQEIGDICDQLAKQKRRPWMTFSNIFTISCLVFYFCKSIWLFKEHFIIDSFWISLDVFDTVILFPLVYDVGVFFCMVIIDFFISCLRAINYALRNMYLERNRHGSRKFIKETNSDCLLKNSVSAFEMTMSSFDFLKQIYQRHVSIYSIKFFFARRCWY